MMKTYLKYSLLLFLVFSIQKINAQNQIIELRNPSFEDFPRPGSTPRGWFDCGRIQFPNESPPDVHPEEYYAFDVHQVAIEGETYLGLVVRENDSWESVAQKLDTALNVGQCYSFSIFLSRSNTYKSSIRGSDVRVNFTQPIKLRIWGGTGYCDRGELLAESDLVENIIWEKFTFYLKPKSRITYIELEAFYKTPVLVPPNGNILLDNASLTQRPNCDDKKIAEKKIRTKLSNASLKEYQKRFDLEADRYKKRRTSNTLKLPYGFDEIKSNIEEAGLDIDFIENKLTPDSEIALKKIANYMEDLLPPFQLVIDFNGIETEEGKQREKGVLKILNANNLTEENYEIRNSKYHYGKVDWLIRQRTFYLGILLKEKE